MPETDRMGPSTVPPPSPGTLPYASRPAPVHPVGGYPRSFWVANGAELFERAAFYATFVSLTTYLSREIGFSDVRAGIVSGLFSFVLYFLPPFTGALADRIGFRRALLLAFFLLACGYAQLGLFQSRLTAIGALLLIATGGAIVKPVISGTAAKSSDSAGRARAFSIFYFMVNIGSFTGKTVAAPLRTGFDLGGYGHFVLGLKYINLYSAAMCVVAFALIALFYRNLDAGGSSRSLGDVARGLLQVVRNGRFMCLILIVAGFWLIQGQLYASMPKYILRLLGESAKPEWLANINPLVVVLLVTPITHIVRHVQPVNSIVVAMSIIPLSALCVSLSSLVQAAAGNSVSVLGWFSLHPITLMVVIGIGLMGLAECFLSPKFMEFASKQAPEGQVAQYMGFQNLSSAFAWLIGFLASGFLLEKFCPDPDKLPAPIQADWQAAIASGGTLPDVYAHAHYIWFVFAGIGAAALLALLLFKYVTGRADRVR